jgi:N-acetylneuraminic acid mutarotase
MNIAKKGESMLCLSKRTKLGLKQEAGLFLFLAFLSACGGGGDGNTPPPPNPVSPPYWTWMSGSNAPDQGGTYGTKGIPAAANVPGGRDNALSWVDSSGKFWLFGGEGFASSDYKGSRDYVGALNDLWKFDPATLEWTWVSGSDIADQAGIYGTKGVASPSNVPRARYEAVSWIDSQGKFWLFGGVGYDSNGYAEGLNDLWKFDPATLEWTWVSGSDIAGQAGTYGTKGVAAPSNVPGARGGAVSWIDSSGKLWLFGGGGFLNDLWKFDPTTNEWTWVSGSDTERQSGIYGTKGIPDPSNIPGGRWGAVSWLDSLGNLWLFGGYCYEGTGTSSINDLWKYDPTTNEWTWVSGGNTFDQAGVYGTKGTADPLNVPGARNGAISWIDSDGMFWLFGGGGTDSAGTHGMINDLWKLDPTTLEWTWVSGYRLAWQKGFYGTKGTADATGVPGARLDAVSWIGSSGKLWLFGGHVVYSTTNSSGDFNDLWQFTR